MSDVNDRKNIAFTIESYEHSLDEYLKGTPAEVSGEFKNHIDSFLQLLPVTAKILEIGSGSGRDAAYIAEKGFAVQVSDVARSFLTHLENQGHSTIYFDVLTTDLEQKFDAIIANAVLLHFNEVQCKTAVKNIYRHLAPHGLFLLRLKRGMGEEISSHKLGRPRYFKYWEADSLKKLLESHGFQVVLEHHTSDNQWLQYILRRNSV
jgi:SAM-dependent methyltransferase